MVAAQMNSSKQRRKSVGILSANSRKRLTVHALPVCKLQTGNQ